VAVIFIGDELFHELISDFDLLPTREHMTVDSHDVPREQVSLSQGRINVKFNSNESSRNGVLQRFELSF